MNPRLTLLGDAERRAIHAATLDVLSQAGVRYASGKALDLLRAAGAEVDSETTIVKLPPRLVDEKVAEAPRTVLLAARDPGNDIVLDGTRTWLTLDGTGSNTLDPETGKRRLDDGRCRACGTSRRRDRRGRHRLGAGQPYRCRSPSRILEQLATLLEEHF